MTELDSISNAEALPVTLVPPGRRALTSAAKIRHTEPVPGQSDNDADSWRKHMVDGLAANREAIRHAQARLDTLGTYIDEDGFAVVTADQAEAGYAYQARDGALPANQPLALVPGNRDTAIAAAPSAGIVLYMRVPAAADPATVRIDHRRGASLVASYPRAADAWERTTALTGRSPHYDYYRLVDDALGSLISISGVQANDTFVMRVHGHESAQLGQAIQELRERLDTEEHHSEALRTEIELLEHKVSAIVLERDTSPWAATTDNADGLRLGKVFWLPTHQDDPTFLGGADWLLRSTATQATLTEVDEHNFFGFIAKNDSTWRNIRGVVRDADGNIVATYSPQNGRTSSQTPRRVPAALGDHTLRYMTNSDGLPAFIPRIGIGYTVTVEERTDTDIPVWDGPISHDLRERVAANEVQLASINQQLRNDIANPVFRDILEIDDNSDWDGGTTRFRIFSHTIADVKDGDFVEIDWLNFNTTSDIFRHFAVHGSTETQGRFIFHGRDIAQRSAVRPNTAAGASTASANGFIGATSGVLRRQSGQNLADDPGGAVIWWFLYRVGTTVHLDAAASVTRNPQGAGKMPEGFYMRSRTWRESAQVQSTRLLPDRPNAVADRRGLVPKFDAEGNLGYHQAVGPVQLLAFRSRITGDWTLGAPTGELTVTDLGFSGTTLRINARKALRSKSYGVIVTVTRGTDEISRVPIPWSLFRTGDSNYVTGGGHGTQGIPAGYWSDAANAYLVAMADWAFDHDRFELTVRGGATDTNSILRVHLAR